MSLGLNYCFVGVWSKLGFSHSRYFGAARDLPGVRELFEQPRKSATPSTCN